MKKPSLLRPNQIFDLGFVWRTGMIAFNESSNNAIKRK
jgi:hypothetical protein